MTTKVLAFLSPPGNTIEIFAGGGMAMTANINPCRYEIEADEEDIAHILMIAAAALEALPEEGDDAEDDL